VRDAETALALGSEQLVQQFIINEPIYNLAEMKKMLKTVVLNDYEEYSYGRLAIELKSTGELISYAGLNYIKELQTVDLEFRLKSDFGKWLRKRGRFDLPKRWIY
jgi:hypothetical protein